jgi:hypothetical protein
MIADVLYIRDSFVDVMLVADHFVMVTTIEVDHNSTQDEIETAAWDRLTAEYGIDWIGMTRQFINKVSIEVVPQPTINDIMKSLEEEEMSDDWTTS